MSALHHVNRVQPRYDVMMACAMVCKNMPDLFEELQYHAKIDTQLSSSN
jgi:hypothetical protein